MPFIPKQSRKKQAEKHIYNLVTINYLTLFNATFPLFVTIWEMWYFYVMYINFGYVDLIWPFFELELELELLKLLKQLC